MFLHQDVTSEPRWVEVVAEVVKRYGRLDILVSNAGIGISVPSIVQMSLEDWRRQTAINLDGVFLSVKHCLPAMRRTGGGSIIMMSSLAGLRGARRWPAIARPRAASGCSPRRSRWSAPRSATASGSIRCIPASSTRRSGARFRRKRAGSGQNAPIDPEERARLATPFGRAGHASEIAQRRAVSGVRCIALRHRNGTRHRWRHERGRRLRLPAGA